LKPVAFFYFLFNFWWLWAGVGAGDVAKVAIIHNTVKPNLAINRK
jgi:hypothetical protein